MDEYEKMMQKQGQYALFNFNLKENLTMSSGFLNTRSVGISSKNIQTESRLKNIQLKNTKDQEVKKNLFKPNEHINYYRADNTLEPAFTRAPKSCNNISDISYIGYTFQPNLQSHDFVGNEFGKDTRHENR